MYKPQQPQSKYDTPGEDGIEIVDDSPVGKAKEAAGAAGGALKKYWIFIVLGIVVLAAGYFAYDFFVGSVKTVSFDVTDTEGNAVTASVRVFDSGNKEVGHVGGSGSLQLRKGNYTYKISSAGFKPEEDIFTVESDNRVDVQLQKNIQLELSGDIPDALVQGESKTMTFTISNTGDEVVETGLVFEGTAFTTANASFSYQNPVVVAPDSQTEVVVEVDVKETAKTGTALTGTVRVEGLKGGKAQVTGPVEIVKFGNDSIRISPISIDYSSVNEGALGSKQLTIENKNEFEVKDLHLEVEVLTQRWTDAATIKSWFVISENDFSIFPEEKKVVTLNVSPVVGESSIPSSEKFEDITGKLVISNTYYAKDVPIKMKVNKSEVEVSIKGFTIPAFSTKDGEYPPKTLTLTISNDGKLEIGEVTVSNTDAADKCRTDTGKDVPQWIKLDETQLGAIQPGESRQVKYFVNPQGGVEGETAICKVTVRYFNPRTGGRESITSNPAQITLGR